MRIRLIVATLVLALSVFPAMAGERPDTVAHLNGGPNAVEFQPFVDHDSLLLTVSTPDGQVYSKEFKSGAAVLRLQDLPAVVDGSYSYQLTVVPRVSASVKKQLADARAKDDDAAVKAIQRANGLANPLVQSGGLMVVGGAFVPTNATEATAKDAVLVPKVSSVGGVTAAAAMAGRWGNPTVQDVVTADDEIIQGSLCVGLDCVNNESFGFDTIRLKENNTRIGFMDTSTSAGFPTTDWQLTANDSASGGLSKFSIDNITDSRTPFTVKAGAPTNSLWVDDSGKVGLGNSSPGLNIHITASDTPAIRQEQTNAGGFTAQTWDIGANEANWFVRDLTGGSRLPFRIRPGATTSSVDISSDGDVGINTASPNANTKLDVFDSTQVKARISLTGQEYYQASNTSTDGIAILLGVNRTGNRQVWFGDTAALTQNSTNRVIRFYPSAGQIDALATNGTTGQNLTLNGAGGNLAIGGVFTPTNPIQHNNGAFLSAGGVWTDACSREYKQNIQSLDADAAMQTLKALTPVTYEYKKAPEEQHVGFIAEDAPDLVAAANHKGMAPMDVVAVLTKVVQEQQKTIDDLKAKVDELSQQKP